MKKIFAILPIVLTSQVLAQNVGINTTAVPRAKLEVEGVAGGGATSAVFGGDGAGVSFQKNWPTIGFNQFRDDVTPGSQGKYLANGFAAIHYLDPNSGTMYLETFPSGIAKNHTPAANGRLIMKANGNVGICTPNPNATLAVGRGNIATNTWGTATFRGIEIQSHFNFYTNEDTYIRGGTSSAGIFINRNPVNNAAIGGVVIGGGLTRVGINSPGEIPSATVVIKQPIGKDALSFIESSGSWLQYTLGEFGGLGLAWRYYSGLYGPQKGQFSHVNGAYTAFSDSSLKKNVETMPSVLDKINLLKPVTYEMKKDNPDHKKSIGFIAQEVKELFPLLVRQINSIDRNSEPITDLYTMNYSGFGVLAIKALQEQHGQIKALEKELDDLLAELETLSAPPPKKKRHWKSKYDSRFNKKLNVDYSQDRLK